MYIENLMNDTHWGEDFDFNNLVTPICEIEALSNAIIEGFGRADNNYNPLLAETINEKIIKFKEFLNRLSEEKLKMGSCCASKK